MLQRNPIFRDLDEIMNSKWMPFATTETSFPMDIIERDDEYEVKVVVPGVNKENLTVTIENNSLHIEAISTATKADEGAGTYLLRGLKDFSYKRTIPNISQYGVDEAEISSMYKNCILSIILPKAEEAKPKSITVAVE